jgi:hypothetical protein
MRGWTPTSAAIERVLRPSAASNTMHARFMSRCAVVGARQRASSTFRIFGLSQTSLALGIIPAPKSVEKPSVDPAAELTRCFLRLTNLPTYALDRLSRYEAPLWRHAGQILFALDALDRRKPWDRRRRLRFAGRQEFPAYAPDEC